MPTFTQTCTDCQISFPIDEAEQAFLTKVSPVISGQRFQIPLPHQCPECRLIHRLSFRNRRSLYRQKCTKTGKDILSMYSSNSPYTVYDVAYWESDAFDATEYGRDFDFDRPFFEQFYDLKLKVPRPNLSVVYENMENADFVNGAGDVKNAYLAFNLVFVEDVYYSNGIYHSKNIVDSLYLNDCELCYECVDGKNLYHCFWTQDCVNSSDLWFCIDCRSSKNCFGSTGLRNKEYYIYNQAYSKEAYEAFIAQLTWSESMIVATQAQVAQLDATCPHQYSHILNSENCTGDYISNAKNCYDSFDVGEGTEDLRYCYFVKYNTKDAYDATFTVKNAELLYQCQCTGFNTSNVIFSSDVYNQAQDVMYSDTCYTSVRNLFGCVGIKRKEYCILNKQYSKEEYEALVPRIIQHMQKTGEWGQFFPKHLSPFAYNETEVMYPFPKTKEQALSLGYKWSDKEKNPSSSTALTCSVTGKAFRLIPQERAFYDKMKLPYPTKCPEQRHLDRFAKRTPPKLWLRTCDKCKVELQSPYSPERPETVYCSQCYLSSTY